MNYSKVESDRFGFNIFREIALEPDFNQIAYSIIEKAVDILILRIPSIKQNQLHKLTQKGFPFLVADNLVYYKTDLNRIDIKQKKNVDIDYTIADSTHHETLQNLVKTIFDGYTNHYFSNPYFPKESILEGYQEWAQNLVTCNNPETITFLIKRGEKFIGFASCGFDNNKNECEGILYGVVDEESGKGLYSDLIRHTQKYFKDLGFHSMKVSTQIQNFAVQKVWSKEGFFLTESYITIHVNSFLSHSKIEKKTIEFMIDEVDVKKFGNLTGDLNPLHFDDDFAKSKGFDRKIAHGIILNSYLTKYFGMEHPGAGTIFMNYSYQFYKPIYTNKKYSFEVSFPVINSNGFHLAVVKVFDAQEKLCLISYNQLIKK